PNSSEVEEDSLVRPLEVDVEPVAVAGRLREQGPPTARWNAAQHRVGVVGVGLVREVDPGDAAVQHPAGEHRDVDVGRLSHSPRAGKATGLDGHQLKAAVPLLGAAAAK